MYPLITHIASSVPLLGSSLEKWLLLGVLGEEELTPLQLLQTIRLHSTRQISSADVSVVSNNTCHSSDDPENIPLSGEIAVDLPSTAGWYRAALVDCSPEDSARSAEDTRLTTPLRVLAISEPFQVQITIDIKPEEMRQEEVSAVSTAFSVLIEDMRLLQCLHASIQLGGVPYQQVNHITATLGQISESKEIGKAWQLSVCCNVLGRQSDGSYISAAVVLHLNIPSDQYMLLGYGTRDFMSHKDSALSGGFPVGVLNWESGKVQIRLPYERKCASSLEPTGRLETFLAQCQRETAAAVDISAPFSYEVLCKHCNNIVAKQLEAVELFPSGRFDDV